MLNDWMHEKVEIKDSKLYKRVYRNEEQVIKHVNDVIGQNNGVVVLFIFSKHFPETYDVLEFLNIIKECELEIEEIRSINIVRLLYKDWLIEITINLSVSIVAGIMADIIFNKILDKFKRKRIDEEIKEVEEYYPNGNIKRVTRKYKKYKN